MVGRQGGQVRAYFGIGGVAIRRSSLRRRRARCVEHVGERHPAHTSAPMLCGSRTKAAAATRPPLLPPCTAMRSGELMPRAAKSRTTASRSSALRCLCLPCAAACQCLNSPPPRTLATTKHFPVRASGGRCFRVVRRLRRSRRRRKPASVCRARRFCRRGNRVSACRRPTLPKAAVL